MRDTTDGLALAAVQQTLLGEAADNAEIGGLVWNAERRYVSANPKACSLIGTTREQLLSSQVGETNRSPEAQAAIDAIIAKVPANGGMSVFRPDGSVVDLDWVVFPTTLAGLPHVIGLFWE